MHTKGLNFIKIFLQEHFLAVLCAIVVGLIYVGPQLLFILSLGDKYQGIPMLHTANEDFYLARIHEILDGHPAISSHAFFEYKNQWPVQPPTIETLYAIPSMIFGISPANVLIASKFVLPFILFFLVYFLVIKLTEKSPTFLSKASAVSGALFVTLGYDLIDYRRLWLFISGQAGLGGSFLLWSRPINPISGIIFLIAFLFFAWSIIEKTRRTKMSVFGASFFLALMMGSYFFGWGIALSILFALILFFLGKKEFTIVKQLATIVPLAILLAAPYWYVVWKATQSQWYSESMLRNGLFYTHYPLINKFMLAVLVVYIIFVFALSKEKFANFKNWHWMTLAFILGSFWAYNQQIITGMTIWPYHFVSYTIPLGMIVLVALLYNYLHTRPIILTAAIIIIAMSSIIYGCIIQISVYKRLFEQSVETQTHAPVLRLLDSKPNDCVVLVNEIDERTTSFAGLIPAFTHCDLYASTWVHSLMPTNRSYHNYAVALKLKGVSANSIDKHIEENRSEAVGYLFSNWKGLYGAPDFPDFSDSLLEDRIKQFPEQYKIFSKNDFRTELEKYKLDYIISFGELNSSLIRSLKLKKSFDDKTSGIVVYSF